MMVLVNTDGKKASAKELRSNYLPLFTSALIVLTTSSYIKNKESADLTVVYGDKKYRFHEFLLCSQSSFFSKALRNFKVSETHG